MLPLGSHRGFVRDYSLMYVTRVMPAALASMLTTMRSLEEALIKSVRGEPFDFTQDRPVEP